ncbi:hypothetical protein Tco_0774785 [Tanacetum coccineum]|uniref:Reverse transcriptase domain-containing protein n=1 Tax=Tanacetum coccineum TaxID=301880 RepID=A0ABQ4ZPG8_9ASTR
MNDVYNVFIREIPEEMFANKIIPWPSHSFPPFLTSHTDLTSPEVVNQSSGNPTPILEPETKSSSSFPPHLSPSKKVIPYLSSLLIKNSLSGSTTSSSPSLHISETSNYFLEEFADELAHITFPPGNDDLPFDAKSDLLELEYLLNHDPIKDMDSILEDSVDENSLDDNLDDTISEEFTDELAPSESFPPGDDDMTLKDTVNDDTYDDPFDFKEKNIKDSKILIDELDLPESNNVLFFPECNSVFYEDFSEVEAIVFNQQRFLDFKASRARRIFVLRT